MPQQRFDIVIGARDLYSRVLKGAETRLQSFKKNWVATTAVIAGTGFALKRAFDFAEEAAQFDQAEQAFANLAASHGANSRQIIANLKAASAQTIATADLMQAAGQAMLLGIPADKLDEMMRIARASSRVTGQTIQKSFLDIATGIGRQSKLILDNLGIIVNAKDAYDEYAASVNKTTAELTDMEKKQAFANATMKAGAEIVERVNVQTRTAAEAMQTFKAGIADLGITIGKVFITALSGLTSALAFLATGFNTWVTALLDTLNTLVRLGEKIPGVGKAFTGLSEDIDRAARFMDNLADASAKLSIESFGVATNIWKEKEAIDAKTNAIKEQAATIATSGGEAGGVTPPGFDAAQAQLDARFRAQEEHTNAILDLKIKEEQELAERNKRITAAEQARANITGVAYNAMQDQMLSLIETGKFSVGAMARVIAQQVKIELTGIAARSAVWAIFETARGLAAAATGNPAASLHFASAKHFAGAAGIALAGAAGVHGLFGGTAERPAPGTVGGEPVRTTPAGTALPAAPVQQALPTQHITINIHNPLSEQNWQKITEDNIVPAIRDAQDRNVLITVAG